MRPWSRLLFLVALKHVVPFSVPSMQRHIRISPALWRVDADCRYRPRVEARTPEAKNLHRVRSPEAIGGVAAGAAFVSCVACTSEGVNEAGEHFTEWWD